MDEAYSVTKADTCMTSPGAFTLAYILRAGVNFLTTFIRLLQRRSVQTIHLSLTGYYSVTS
jgi:hypothetical protein